LHWQSIAKQHYFIAVEFGRCFASILIRSSSTANALGDEGTKIIGDALQKNTSVLELCLSGI
jgi:hypothetical protein